MNLVFVHTKDGYPQYGIQLSKDRFAYLSSNREVKIRNRKNFAGESEIIKLSRPMLLDSSKLIFSKIKLLKDPKYRLYWSCSEHFVNELWSFCPNAYFHEYLVRLVFQKDFDLLEVFLNAKPKLPAQIDGVDYEILDFYSKNLDLYYELLKYYTENYRDLVYKQ